jgi:hypothetical protein
MNLETISAIKLQETVQSVQVELFKDASKQVEAVMASLLQSLDSFPQSLPSHKGQILNITA